MYVSARPTPFCRSSFLPGQSPNKKERVAYAHPQYPRTPHKCGERMLRVGTKKHRATEVYCGETASQGERLRPEFPPGSEDLTPHP